MEEDHNDLFGGAPPLKPLSIIQQRLVRSSLAIEQDDADSILFMHSVLCQTGMPYRNPGDDARAWERVNGHAHLEILAGKAMHPEKGRLVEVGLPYGPKPRLILSHLNTEALRTQNPKIEIEDSLTAFVKRIGLASHGRNSNTVKDQLARLSASSIRIGVLQDGRATTVNSQIVTAFDIWFPKDERQRVLWPATIRLSLDYFESLLKHAVPLDERAIASLSHSAMALDLYCWLAQRLHRVDPGKPAFIPWVSLHQQFGWHYERMDKFKAVFRHTLGLVGSQYRAARIELDGRGMALRNSPTPVKGRFSITR